MRLNNRNKQAFWYAPYTDTRVSYDDYGNESGAHAVYGKPVKATGVISPARGRVEDRQFGEDDLYTRQILLEDRDTPIDEYAVLWVDMSPQLDASGNLATDENGNVLTPWDYIVRRVARGLPTFGGTVLAIDKVSVSAMIPGGS